MKNILLTNEKIKAYILKEGMRVRDDDFCLESILEEFALEIEEELTGSFERAAEPLMKFMGGLHPHHAAIVTTANAELLEGQETHLTDDFVRD